MPATEYGGNDTIYNANNGNVTIMGGDGRDSIKNGDGYRVYTHGVSIVGGAGNDWISLHGSNATISGDYISTTDGDSNSINGGTGNDNLNNSGANSTIISGTGNDTINTNGDYVYVAGDNGSDYIYGDSGRDVSLLGGDGNDTIEACNNNNGFVIGGAGMIQF